MYKIVYAKEKLLGDAIKEVEENVNKLKSQGWIEQGGISISIDFRTGAYFPCTAAQAMVKNEK